MSPVANRIWTVSKLLLDLWVALYRRLIHRLRLGTELSTSEALRLGHFKV